MAASTLEVHLEHAGLDRNRLTRHAASLRTALSSLDADQLVRLRANGGIISAPIDNIESSAGGSVRCMLAEIHLPRETN